MTFVIIYFVIGILLLVGRMLYLAFEDWDYCKSCLCSLWGWLYMLVAMILWPLVCIYAIMDWWN